MSWRIEKSVAYEADVEELAEYGFRQFGRKTMLVFLLELDNTESLLASYPNIGSSISFDGEESCRKFNLDPYIIYYRVTSHAVVLLRIIRQERNADNLQF